MAETLEADATHLPQNPPALAELSTSAGVTAEEAPEATDNTAQLTKAIQLLNENQEKLMLLVEKLIKADQNMVDQSVKGMEPKTEDSGGGQLEPASELARRAASETLSKLFPTAERMAAMVSPFLLSVGNGGIITSTDRFVRPLLTKRDPKPGIDPVIVLKFPAPLEVSWGLYISHPNNEASDQLKQQWLSTVNRPELGHSSWPLRGEPEIRYSREAAAIKFGRTSVRLWFKIATCRRLLEFYADLS